MLKHVSKTQFVFILLSLVIFSCEDNVSKNEVASNTNSKVNVIFLNTQVTEPNTEKGFKEERKIRENLFEVFLHSIDYTGFENDSVKFRDQIDLLNLTKSKNFFFTQFVLEKPYTYWLNRGIFANIGKVSLNDLQAYQWNFPTKRKDLMYSFTDSVLKYPNDTETINYRTYDLGFEYDSNNNLISYTQYPYPIDDFNAPITPINTVASNGQQNIKLKIENSDYLKNADYVLPFSVNDLINIFNVKISSYTFNADSSLKIDLDRIIAKNSYKVILYYRYPTNKYQANEQFFNWKTFVHNFELTDNTNSIVFSDAILAQLKNNSIAYFQNLPEVTNFDEKNMRLQFMISSDIGPNLSFNLDKLDNSLENIKVVGTFNRKIRIKQ